MIRSVFSKYFVVAFLGFTLSSCSEQFKKSNHYSDEVVLKVLGTIQDGGIPHTGCSKKCCRKYFESKSVRIGVSSIGVSNFKYNSNYIIDATPDLNFQLHTLIGNTNPSKNLNGIFLTHAHMGHYAGLLNFGREALNSKNIPVYLMPEFFDYVSNNGPWDQLVALNNIKLIKIANKEKIDLHSNLSFTPILVPHRDEYSETVGFIIEGNNKTALYIPDIDKWAKWNFSITEMIKIVDYALLDGTFFDEKEINNRDISEIPHPFVIESLELLDSLEDIDKAKVYFIHLNHTNPLLNKNSEEYIRVISNGFNVAESGMELIL